MAKTYLAKKDHAHSEATTSAAGFMSASDKSKLDGIASGANKYTHPSYTAKSSGLYKVTVDATGHVSATTAVAKSDITALGIPAQDTTYSAATTSTAGLMSAADKTKLDGIATGANAYTLPTASSSTLGGVKTTSTVTSTSGLTACPIISGVPYYKDSNTTYSLSSFGITATAAELNILDGVTATATELNYMDGVTSNVQTQLNAKQATVTGAATTITGSNLTASRALISNSSGKVAVSAVTSTELGYLDGVTSSIQTQLNGKASSTHNHAGETLNPMVIELGKNSSGHGGYIDFHYNNSSDDYTSRIIESASGTLENYCDSLITHGDTTITGTLSVGNNAFIKSGITFMGEGVHTGRVAGYETNAVLGSDGTNAAYLMLKNDSAVASSLLFLFTPSGGSQAQYKILGEHNKPSGTYSGNSGSQTIDTGAIGDVILVQLTGSGGGFAIVTKSGAIGKLNSNNTFVGLADTEANFIDGVLTLNSSNYAVNRSGYGYNWQVL